MYAGTPYIPKEIWLEQEVEDADAVSYTHLCVNMWGTIIVAGILVVIVAAILFGMRKDRKSGKGSCGGDCSKCKGCH